MGESDAMCGVSLYSSSSSVMIRAEIGWLAENFSCSKRRDLFVSRVLPGVNSSGANGSFERVYSGKANGSFERVS